MKTHQELGDAAEHPTTPGHEAAAPDRGRARRRGSSDASAGAAVGAAAPALPPPLCTAPSAELREPTGTSHRQPGQGSDPG